MVLIISKALYTYTLFSAVAFSATLNKLTTNSD